MSDHRLTLDIPDEIIAEILNFVSRYPKYSIVSKRFQNVYKEFYKLYKSPKYLKETYPYYDFDTRMVKYHMVKAALNRNFDDVLVLISTKVKKKYSFNTNLSIRGILAAYALLVLYVYKDVDSNMDRIYYILGKYYNDMVETIEQESKELYADEYAVIERLTTNKVYKYKGPKDRKRIGYKDFGTDSISIKITEYPWDTLTIKIPGYIDIPFPLIISHDKYFDTIYKNNFYHKEYINIIANFSIPTPLIIKRMHQLLDKHNIDLSPTTNITSTKPIYTELFWDTPLFLDLHKKYEIDTVTGIMNQGLMTIESTRVYALVAVGAIPKLYMDMLYNSV